MSEKEKIFPNFWQALLYGYILPLIIIIAALSIFYIYKILSFDKLVAFNHNFGHVVTIPILLFFLWKSKTILQLKSVNINPKQLLIVVLLTIGVEAIFFGTISMFETLFNREYPPSSESTYVSVIHALLVAPIIEELLYRRVFLHQFLKQYSPWTAIVLSTVLFVVPHIPTIIFPELFIPFFISGSFLGLIYYKTRSISLCIISHSIMNLATYFVNI